MSTCRPGRQVPAQPYELIVNLSRIRSAASCAIRLDILQKAVQPLTRKRTVARKTKGNVRVLSQCHKLSGQRGNNSTTCPSSALFFQLEQQSPVCQSGSMTTSVCRSGQVEGIQVDQTLTVLASW